MIGDRKPKLLPASHLIPGMDGVSLGDFWSWAYSDFHCNTTRPIFAEFIVGTALGCLNGVRLEWDCIDLQYRGKKIEVKSSAYLQTWRQKRHSTIRFDIAAALPWDAATNETGTDSKRAADVYVFSLYPETDEKTADPLYVSAWEFYVVPTRSLNETLPHAKSLSLAGVRELTRSCKFDELRSAVDAAIGVE